MPRIYLDHQATTQVDPRVMEAMAPFFSGNFGNPSSQHAEGRAARRAVEEAREEVAAFLGAEPKEVVFTSGATEANRLAIESAASERAGPIAASQVEHHSILDLVSGGAPLAPRAELFAVNSVGCVSEQTVTETLERRPAILCLMAANNEIGTIQPFAFAADLAVRLEIPILVDAVAALGRIPISATAIELGFVTLSGHKLGAPKGIGALVVRGKGSLRSKTNGKGQERGLRPGTENVPGIVGIGKACQLARTEGALRRERLARADAAFCGEIQCAAVPLRLTIPNDADRVPGILSLRWPSIFGEQALVALDLAGVAVSLGSACASGAALPSSVLAAIGKSRVENLETFRVSLGSEFSEAEARAAARLLIATLKRVAEIS